MQFFAYQNGHVGSVQAGKALTDGEHLDEFLVIDPMPLSHEAAAKVRHHTTEAGGSDEQEFEEYLGD